MIEKNDKNRILHSLLPADAIDELVKAASTKNTEFDQIGRQRAIESATQRVKHRYPQFFRHHETRYDDDCCGE